MELQGGQAVGVGMIYKMNLDEIDDVTPKGGLTYRPKYFIIIGSADYGYYVAYILINKSINLKYSYSKELLDCQFPLRVNDYPNIFNIDPSFANLSRIREMDRDRLLKEATYQGQLTAKDLEQILYALKSSKVISAKAKKRYGLV